MTDIRIALFNAEKDGYSQTFVRDHLTRLPGTVMHLYGGAFNWQYQQKPLFWLPYRAINYFADRAPRNVVERAQGRMNGALANFLQREKVDVVLAEFADAAVHLVDACEAAGVPLVVHCHGYDVYVRALVEPKLALYRKLFGCAAGIVVVSQAMRQRVIELGAHPERVTVNSCGVDHAVFSPDAGNERSQTLIAVGRFVEKKAPHLTILAFDKALQACPEAKLVMVGDGPLFDACVQLARALKISEAIRFVGKQDHRAVSKLMSAARAFVQHSVVAPSGDSEGSPVSVLEAGAAGLPVIATRHAGILDSVVENETGFLVDEYDIDAMARHMVTLLTDAKLAARMGSSARVRVQEHFSMEKSISTLAQVLSRAARRQPEHLRQD